jgi:hypothetical protein
MWPEKVEIHDPRLRFQGRTLATFVPFLDRGSTTILSASLKSKRDSFIEHAESPVHAGHETLDFPTVPPRWTILSLPSPCEMRSDSIDHCRLWLQRIGHLCERKNNRLCVSNILMALSLLRQP